MFFLSINKQKKTINAINSMDKYSLREDKCEIYVY